MWITPSLVISVGWKLESCWFFFCNDWSQAQLQFPTHLTSPYFVPHASSKALTKLPQQQLWAAQLAAQYRNTGTSTAMTHFPSWPNGRQDSPGLMPYVSPSTSTLDVPGPKYPQISQQQQQLMAITLPHARMKRQSVYEENGVRFWASGGVLPLHE